MTIHDLSVRDPAIGALAIEAAGMRFRNNQEMEQAYAYDFKPRIRLLAGWYRTSGPTILQSSDAYLALITIIRDSLEKGTYLKLWMKK